MYTQKEIESAIEHGVFTPETAQRLHEHVERLRLSPDENERFRLIAGFNDIFVVIACLLLVAAAFFLFREWSVVLGGVAAAVVSWGLAEYFIQRRRMALPAIVLPLTFIGSIGFGALHLFTNRALGCLAMLVCSALAAYAHWRRFCVPITVAAGSGAVASGVLMILLTVYPPLHDQVLLFLFVLGCVVFMLAMYWDVNDVRRVTYRSDVAFWLHLLAAPLLVHPVFIAIGISSSGPVSGTQLFVVLVLYLFIAVCALLIDRRALLVSALVYVFYALGDAIDRSGLVSQGFAITALLLGITLLLLSIFWRQGRERLLQQLPRWLKHRLAA